MQLQRGIGQDGAQTELGKRRSYPSHGYPGIGVTSQDESSDHNVVTGHNEPARADVSQLRVSGLTKVVKLDETHAGAVVLTGQDGGKLSGSY